jgi:hypothetical protein
MPRKVPGPQHRMNQLPRIRRHHCCPRASSSPTRGRPSGNSSTPLLRGRPRWREASTLCDRESRRMRQPRFAAVRPGAAGRHERRTALAPKSCSGSTHSCRPIQCSSRARPAGTGMAVTAAFRTPAVAGQTSACSQDPDLELPSAHRCPIESLPRPARSLGPKRGTEKVGRSGLLRPRMGRRPGRPTRPSLPRNCSGLMSGHHFRLGAALPGRAGLGCLDRLIAGLDCADRLLPAALLSASD